MLDESAEHFRFFQKALESSIARYSHLVEDGDEDAFQTIQKGQVEQLAALEDEFRLALIRHSRGPAVYEAFVDHITGVRKNILAARPYFRERQKIFTSQIARALEARNAPRLYSCRVNYQFVAFAMKAAKWRPGSAPARLARKIAATRWELVVLNMPLAISRARIFYGKTPKSHLSFMDLVQHAAEGLISAIDKFELPYTEVFNGVACGWMTGNFIEAYSETMLHFYPKDKRRIYRANKFRARFPDGSYDVGDLVKAVNEKMPERSQTSEAEVMDLMAASSMVSSDTKAPGETDDVPDNVARYAAPASTRPDLMVEHQEAVTSMRAAARRLTLRDRKLLRLRGVDVELT